MDKKREQKMRRTDRAQQDDGRCGKVYTEGITVLLDVDTYNWILDKAEEHSESKGSVVRRLIAEGLWSFEHSNKEFKPVTGYGRGRHEDD